MLRFQIVMRTVLRRALICFLALAILAMVYLARPGPSPVVSRGQDANGLAHVTLLSGKHTIDQIYQSMQGPRSLESSIYLSEPEPRHLLWVTGVESKLTAGDGASLISREYFCHSNLTFTPDQKLGSSGRTVSTDDRLVTLVPGRLTMKLPDGFGIPVWSDEKLDYFSQSLNLNTKAAPFQVRFRTTIQFRDDARATSAGTMKPLFRRSVYAFEPIGKASPHVMCTGGDHPGAACGPMSPIVGQAASSAFVASLGKTNTIHWLIPPGHFESRVPVTDQLNLPYDTTAHYVTGHLHPFGKSLELFDKTAKESIFKIRSKDFEDKLGVAEMDEWSSLEGAKLLKDHEYELVTVYHNPTDHPIDAMSILYLYAADLQFHADPQTKLAAITPR